MSNDRTSPKVPVVRHLFTAFAAVSLALCVVLGGFWFRQRYAEDVWNRVTLGTRPTPNRNGDLASLQLNSGAGQLQFTRIAESFRYTDTSSASLWDAAGTENDIRGWRHGTSSMVRDPAVPVARSPAEQVKYYAPRWLSRRGLYLMVERQDDHNGYAWTQWLLGVPTCSALVFAVPPALWFTMSYRRRLDRSRAAKGLCPACGYDLRASPGRCPECGFEVTLGRT